jgi:hypothetical protein
MCHCILAVCVIVFWQYVSLYFGRHGPEVQSNQLPTLHIQILSFAMWMEAVIQFLKCLYLSTKIAGVTEKSGATVI